MLQAILDDGLAMKAQLKQTGGHVKPLTGKTVAMIFEKPSIRTRVSFEVGIRQRGGTIDPVELRFAAWPR